MQIVTICLLQCGFMARILAPLINQCIDSHYYMVHDHFRIQLDTLKKEGLPDILDISAFVHDNESVPLLKGSCDPAGVTHDYLCRIDSIPVVTKRIAALSYLEVLEMFDKIKNPNLVYSVAYYLRRNAKYAVVMVWPGYFHKYKVGATYEEISGS